MNLFFQGLLVFSISVGNFNFKLKLWILLADFTKDCKNCVPFVESQLQPSAVTRSHVDQPGKSDSNVFSCSSSIIFGIFIDKTIR